MVFLLNLASYSQQHCHYQSSQTAKKYCDRFFCPCGAEFISFPLSFCCGRWQNFSPFFSNRSKANFFFCFDLQRHYCVHFIAQKIFEQSAFVTNLFLFIYFLILSHQSYLFESTNIEYTYVHI